MNVIILNLDTTINLLTFINIDYKGVMITNYTEIIYTLTQLSLIVL